MTSLSPAFPASTLQTAAMKARLKRLQRHLQHGLIERDTPIRLILLAMLSGEHLLLIGPPGTAKSELARRLRGVFRGGQYFERLLTKFSVPEELFGPLSIKALEEDRYERLTASYLPSASIAFVDEIFKANSAILNALLTLLNEREFDNGAQRVKTPLAAVIGASNELPEGEELDALYDRFLLRYEIGPVSDEGFHQLLQLDDAPAPVLDEADLLCADDLSAVQTAAAGLPLAEDVYYLLGGLRDFLRERHITVSDRRWRKVVKLLQVAAWSNGQSQVEVWDCWLLQYCLWHQPKQRETILQWYQSHLGTDAVVNPERLKRLIGVWRETLEKERNDKRHLGNEKGERLYVDHQGQLTTLSGREYSAADNGEPLYLAPPDQADRSNAGQGYRCEELQEQFFDDHYQQCHVDGKWVGISEYTANPDNRLMRHERFAPHTEPVRYSESHIHERVSATQDLLDAIANFKQVLDRKLATIATDVADHLWLDPGFAVPAQENLRDSLTVIEALEAQIRELQTGFRQLPRQ